MTISFGDPWDTGFKFHEEQQQLQDKIHVFIVIVIFYNCVRVMVDPLKIFWVLTNSTYLGKYFCVFNVFNVMELSIILIGSLRRDEGYRIIEDSTMISNNFPQV